MNFKSVMIAVAALAAPAAGASAQGYYDYAPPPPYAYTGAPAPAPAQSCEGEGFTILGAHAGVTVLGFGLNGGANFTAPSDCGGEGYGQAAPQFEPRPYAPPPGYGPPMAPPPPYMQQGYEPGYGQQGYGYAQPCGCGPQGW